jgi:hypothetical protein
VEGPALWYNTNASASGPRYLVIVYDGYRDLQYWLRVYRLASSGAYSDVGAFPVNNVDPNSSQPMITYDSVYQQIVDDELVGVISRANYVLTQVELSEGFAWNNASRAKAIEVVDPLINS